MNRDGKIWFGAGIDTTQIRRDAQTVKGQFTSIGSQAEVEGGRIDSAMRKAGLAIAGLFSIRQAAMFAQSIAKVRSEFQYTEAMLSVFLGSAEKAKSFMKELSDYSLVNVFDFPDLAESAAQLLSFGTSADDIIPTLHKLSTVAAGVNQPLTRFVELYNRAKSLGTLTTMDIRQWSALGDVITYLAQMMGKSNDEVRKLLSDGKIGFSEIDQLINELTSQGGLFYGVQEAKLDTLGDSIGALRDAYKLMLNDIGEGMQGTFRTGIDIAANLIENYEKIGKIIASLVAVYGTYKAALIAHAAIQSVNITLSKGWTVAELARFKALVMVDKAQKLLNKTMLTNPYIAAATALAALVAGLNIYSKTLGRVKTQEEMLSDIRDESEKNIRGEVKELERLRKVLSDSSKSYNERKLALDRIKEIVPDYHASLTEEGVLIKNNSDALDTYVQKLTITEQIKRAISKQSDIEDEIDRWKDKAGDTLKSAIDKAFSGRANEMLAGERAAFEKYKELSKEAQRYEKIIEGLNTELAGVGGKKTTTTKISTGLTDDEIKAAKEREKLFAEIAKREREQVRKNEDLAFQERQSAIDREDDSVNKELAQLRLNHDRRITELNRQREDLLALIRENAVKEAEAKGTSINVESIALSDEQVSAFEAIIDNEVAIYSTAIGRVYKDLTDKYRDYAAERKEIEKQFQDDIKELTKQYGADSAVIKEAEKRFKKALKDLAESALSEDGRGLLDVYLFGDGSEFITAKIKEALPLFEDITKLTYKELSNVKKIIGDIKLTDKQLEAFKQAGIDVERLVEMLKKAKKAGEEAIDAQKWDKVLDAVRKLSGSLSQLGDALSQSGGALGEVGAIISGLSSNLDNIATTFKAESPIDVVAAGISGIASLYSIVANQIEKNKQAQEEWNAQILQAAHNAAMARIELEAYKESNIFGVENPYAKAIAGAQQYAVAMGELHTLAGDIGGGQVKVDTKDVVSGGNVAGGASAGAAAGAFIGTAIGGWAFGLGTIIGAGIGALAGAIIGAAATETVDVFANLEEEYEEIFDKETFELNQELLNDYDKLDEATRNLIDNWEEIREKALEAQEQMDNTFKELAGDLGNQLSDALVSAFRDGDVFRAIDDFGDKVTGVIESIIAQLIFAQYFDDLFDDLEKGMMSSFDEGGDLSIIDDIINFLGAYENRIEGYSKAMEEAQRELKGYGLDLFSGSRSATAKGFAAMSQDSADELSGRFTAIQLHTYNISEGMKVLMINSSQSLRLLTGIESNTSRLEKIEATMTSVKSGIDDINLKGIYIR